MRQKPTEKEELNLTVPEIMERKMLLWLIPSLLLLNVMVPGVSSSKECRNLEDRRQSFDLSIVSKRNVSGKWVTTFSANHDARNETESVLLDLKQEVHQCGNRQILSIHGTVSETSREEDADKLVFLSKCGKNVAITNYGRTVQKLNVEDRINSVVFTNRPLRKNELFELRVDSKTPKLGYFIGIGVTTLSPYNIEIPPHINNLREGGTWVLYHAHVYSNGTLLSNGNKKNIDQLQVGDRVGIMRSGSGALHLYINGKDEGPLASNLPEALFGAFEVYGDMGQYTLIN